MSPSARNQSLLRPLAALRRALAAQRAYAASASAAAPSSAPPASPPPKGAYVLVLPQLSPTMTRGSVAAWRVREGQSFPAWTVILEVSTDELVEPAYAHGAFAGSVRMLVEAQQAGTVARILVPAADAAPSSSASSSSLAVGTPVAVVVGEDELEEEAGADEGARARVLADARAWGVASELQPLEWQSYLASPSSSDDGGGDDNSKARGGGGGGCG